MAVHFRATTPEIYEARQSELFFKRYTQEPLLYPKVFNVEPITKGHHDAFKVSGLSTFALKPEGTPLSYVAPVQGPVVRVNVDTFGLGYRATKEAKADDQFALLDRFPADLADSARDHMETIAWALFNNGGTTATCLDGLSWFNTAHTTLNDGGNTRSNRANPGVALSTTGLEAAMTNMRTTQSEEGRFIPISPSTLVIHPNDAHLAYQLLDTEKEPFTAENQVSTTRTSRTGITAVDVPYLTDTDAWYLLARKSQHGAQWLNRQDLEFDSSTDSQTKDTLSDAMYRANVRVTEWRGAYASIP